MNEAMMIQKKQQFAFNERKSSVNNDNLQQLVLNYHKEIVNCVTISSDVSMIASGSDDFTIKLYNLKDQELFVILRGHIQAVMVLKFCRNDSCLVSAGLDCQIKLWDLNNSQCITIQSAHSDWITALDFKNDESCFATGSSDNTIKIWNFQNFKVIQDLSVNVNEDGQFLSLQRKITDNQDEIQYIAYNQNDSLLISASNDKCIRVYGVDQNYDCIEKIEGIHNTMYYSKVFSIMDDFLAIAGPKKQITIYKMNNLKEFKRQLESIHKTDTRSVQLTKNSKQLISGDENGQLILITLGGINNMQRLQGDNSKNIRDFALSKDQQFLVTAGWDDTIVVRKLEMNYILSL